MQNGTKSITKLLVKILPPTLKLPKQQHYVTVKAPKDELGVFPMVEKGLSSELKSHQYRSTFVRMDF